MEFWNSLLTEKSWDLLIKLKKEKFNFMLIGGWAAYLWTNLHKSKDIDIVIDNFADLDFLKKNYNLIKNDHLKKYEIKIEEVDVDIYIPFFSRLAIPLEDIKKHTAKVQGFNVVKPEMLLILKQGAEIERKESVKGGKDRIDIMTLLFFSDLDFKEYHNLLKKYKLESYKKRVKEILTTFREIEYLNMNPREFKLKKIRLLDKLK